MAVYGVFDGDPDGGEQLASNRGWSDFGKWADGLDAAKAGQVVHLREHGWSQKLAELESQLAAALSAQPPADKATATTARGLLDLVRRRGGAEVLTVTSGFGSDGGAAGGG